MASTGFSFERVRQAVSYGWDGFTESVNNGIETLESKMQEKAAYAERIFQETTITERDGKYVIKGPFAHEYTCSVSDLAFLSGIISSVILTVGSFFTGHLMLGTIFLLYTGLLCLGAYYLSEWSKNLTAEQIHEKSRQLGIASIGMLKEVVDQHIIQLKAQGVTYTTQITELEALHARLNGQAERMSGQNTLMNNVLVEMEDIAKTLPDKLNPFIVRMGVALGESREVRDEMREQNTTYKEENTRLAHQNTEAVKQLAFLRGQIVALGGILDGFQAERGEYATERQRLAAQVARLRGVISRAEFIVGIEATSSRSASPHIVTFDEGSPAVIEATPHNRAQKARA